MFSIHSGVNEERATMKAKDVFVGQEVSLASSPKIHFGTIVSIKDPKTAVVQFKGTQSTTVYGIKVLVEYKGD